MTETQSIVLGGGCFWCLEAVFQTAPGVRQVVPGYAGGHTPDPDYESVCSGRTGHAEVVRIDFDPRETTLESVLDLFWRCHDPTTPNRQGADTGTQYRSIVLPTDAAQEKIVRESMSRASGRFEDPLVTEVARLETFYPAEAYHQDYYNKNPMAPYCLFVIRPKLEKIA